MVSTQGLRGNSPCCDAESMPATSKFSFSLSSLSFVVDRLSGFAVCLARFSVVVLLRPEIVLLSFCRVLAAEVHSCPFVVACLGVPVPFLFFCSIFLRSVIIWFLCAFL